MNHLEPPKILSIEHVWPYGYAYSPYTQAICDEYNQVNPVWLNVPTNFLGVAYETTQYTTRPVLDDVILLGTCLNVGNVDTGDSGQLIFLQVTETETENYLNSCSIRQGSPATIFAGIPTAVSPILALPEGYFLPKYSRLQHDWANSPTPATGGSLTWLGLKLQKPKQGHSPEWVTVSGRKIRVGSRVPWYYSIGVGTESTQATPPTVSIVAGYRYAQYTRQFDYDIEVKGINCNFFVKDGTTTTPNDFWVKLAETGNCEMWQPALTNLPAMCGAMSQLYPFLPFPQPYPLKKNGKFQFDLISDQASSIGQSFVTFSGVRILE